ncbi:unnamed protein product [Parnassius apollo]|uniref:(apollo) hypothetical protein n=1 Tax=Parnassius apollo TaxID=110799 RepID=A0A8S3X1N1_PARAO|nr:unnamed protein product [Parnassius apollo]
MKFTVVLITLLSVSTSFAIKTKIEEPKDKRETPEGYSGSGYSFRSYQAPSHGRDDASTVSVGAGYNIGGSKPTYSFGGQSSGSGYQFSAGSIPSNGHNSLQLAPITLQPSHGALVSSDLSQLMSQLSHSINSGAINLQQLGEQGASYQLSNLGAHGGQEFTLPQYSYGAPKLQQQFSLFEQSQSVPSYAAGTKGLGSYSSTGPVLFTPSESQSNQQASAYVAPSSSHTLSESGPLSFGSTGHSLSGLSLGNSGYSLGGSFNSLNGGYGSLGKNSFKPSAFLGSSGQSDSGHQLASLSASYGAPSFSGSHLSSGGHGGYSLGSFGPGLSFGGSFGDFGGSSSKFVAPSYLPPKSQGFGSLESVAAFSSGGHLSSPPATTYGIPTSSYSSSSGHAQTSSSSSPQYYVSSSKYSYPGSNFNGGSSYKGPSSGYSSLTSYSFGPKSSFSGSRYGSPKDTHGAYSENSYNTIKYSEELKPRGH